jgi:hypothetical protein
MYPGHSAALPSSSCFLSNHDINGYFIRFFYFSTGICASYINFGVFSVSLTLREEYRLRVCENRVLRRIFGPKRDEVTEDWSKLHNEELHNLYSSPNIIKMIKSRRMRWTWHVARMGRNACRILVGKPEGTDH